MENFTYSGFSDEQLISGYLKGDNKFIGILYSRYFQKVNSRCFSFTRNRDDAFDMTQEILLKAIRNIGSFGGDSKFSTWLYAITNNYCISQSIQKNRKYLHDLLIAQQILADKLNEDNYEERIKREKLEESLDDFLILLSEEERNILVLKYCQNFSIKDLQGEYKLSASAVKMRLLRARLKMAHLMSLEEAA